MKVSHKQAREAAQQLIDACFNAGLRAPAQLSHHDVLMRYIAEREREDAMPKLTAANLQNVFGSMNSEVDMEILERAAKEGTT